MLHVLPMVLWCLRVQVANTDLKERRRVLTSLLICLWLKCCCCLLRVNGRRVMFHPVVVLRSLSLVQLFPSSSVPSLLVFLLPSASIVILVAVLVMFSSGSIRRRKFCGRLVSRLRVGVA